MSVIARALAEIYQPAPADVAEDTPRGLRPAPADPHRYGTLSIDEGQAAMREAVARYLATDNPKHMLLVAAPAGLGKTTLAVETAERYAAGAGRVLYLGPRRDFYADVQLIQKQPGWWYHWEPRTTGPGQGVGQTCRYAPQIEAWMRRGYSALSFCANERICGWSYMHNDCPWHAQARQPEQIIFGQYEHLTLGHPLLERFGLIIGDELPLRAFLHEWRIPAESIVPAGMEHSKRRDLMRLLRQLSTADDAPVMGWRGAALLTALGGAAHVADVCADIPAAEIEPPELRGPDAAEQAPYGHLFTTLRALKREAELAMAGDEWIPRVIVTRHYLTLLQRRVPRTLAPHMIWLDATASAPMYRTLFGRPVEVVQPDVRMAGKVYQVWPSLNTKTAVVQPKTADSPDPMVERKASRIDEQVAQIIRRGDYKAPAIVTYKGLEARFGNFDTTHFHGSRGTNRLEACDALIVIGTPQPGGDDIQQTAAMLYHERDRPFNATWSTCDRPFAGQPWAYPASGFWDDPDLQTLLEQMREAELVQAIHRARPLRRSVDVWLLTNLPVPGVPVALLSLHDLFDAPAGTDPYRWPAIVQLARERMAVAGLLTSADLVQAEICSAPSARRYLSALASREGWRLAPAPPSGRGKPPLACYPPEEDIPL